MIALDTSARVAALLDEPERSLLTEIPATSLVETSIVIEFHRGSDGVHGLDLFLSRSAIEVIPVDQIQADTARVAFRRCGKARHPACLSFGGCFSYALAKTSGHPLLFKGDDFTKTDIPAAQY